MPSRAVVEGQDTDTWHRAPSRRRLALLSTTAPTATGSASSSNAKGRDGAGKRRKGETSFGMTLVLGSMSAAVAESLTFPVDLLKTRTQTAEYRSMGFVSVLKDLLRKEGVSALYSGVSAAVMRHVVYSGIRVVTYEYLKKRVLGKDAVWMMVPAGMFAGALGQLVATPADLAKVAMQTQHVTYSADGRTAKRPFPTPVHVWRSMHASNGIAGLWQGYLPGCCRASLVQLGDLAAYDLIKRSLLARTPMHDNPATHALASLLAGFVSAFLSTPADMIKTRLMVSGLTDQEFRASTGPAGQTPVYRGVGHCIVDTIRNDGILRLWRGLLPNWLRMAPWTITFYFTFEQMRRITGLASF